MSQCLIDEDGQLEGAKPKGGTLPKEKDSTQIVALPPNDDTVFVPNPISLVAHMELALERIPLT